MKILLKLEELALFLAGIAAFSLLNFEWWWFLVLILAPDISMLGYVLGNKAGAAAYNLFHHRAVAVLVWITGYYSGNDILTLTGIILFSHIAMDRMFGYGLKYEKGFKFTHMGEIGK